MEGDSIPVTSYWLDILRAEIAHQVPFAVLGSRYTGHNWDNFETPAQIDYPLRYHLNGNAVYNTSHPVVSSVRETFDTWYGNDTWFSVPRDSFDVYIAKSVLESVSVFDLDLMGYTPTSSIANFASTLTLRHAVREAGAAIVHGGVFASHWPSASCPHRPYVGLFPAVNASARDDAGNALSDVTMVVSDFGTKSTDVFLTSLSAAYSASHAGARAANHCEENHILPFDRYIVVASASTLSTRYDRASNLPSFVHVDRDWHATLSSSLWWDLCAGADTVLTKWFMFASSDFTVKKDFALPINVNAATGGVVPSIPYLRYNSPYCGRRCRAQLNRARIIYPTFDRHVDQEHAVFDTGLARAYCRETRRQYSAWGDPSIDGYFAFVEANSGVAPQTPQRCNNREDAPACVHVHVTRDCTAGTEAGEYVRQLCPGGCGSCNGLISKADAPTKSRRAAADAPAASSDPKPYAYHDTDSGAQPITALVGLPDSNVCEDKTAADEDRRACPCLSEFFYNDLKYSTTSNVPEQKLEGDGCKTWSKEDVPREEQSWCVTSVTSFNVFLPESAAWRFCTSGDSPEFQLVAVNTDVPARFENTTVEPIGIAPIVAPPANDERVGGFDRPEWYPIPPVRAHKTKMAISPIGIGALALLAFVLCCLFALTCRCEGPRQSEYAYTPVII